MQQRVKLFLNCIYRFSPGRLYAHLDPSFSRFATKCPPSSKLLFFGNSSVILYLIEGSGSFSRNPLMIAEWMIPSEIGCCLRPLGIILNEQLATTDFILKQITVSRTISCYVLISVHSLRTLWVEFRRFRWGLSTQWVGFQKLPDPLFNYSHGKLSTSRFIASKFSLGVLGEVVPDVEKM